MKIAAAVMILVASGIWGYLLCSHLSRRVDELDAAVELIALIEARISYYREPLDRLLYVIRTDNILMRGADGDSFLTAWSCAFNKKSLAMKDPERVLMLRFGASLGSTDVSGQRALCEEASDRLRRIRDGAIREREKLFRVGAVLPVFGGIAVILIFI